jgi:hypothetical protein
MYTNEELGFILYNNRSVKGVVSNFLPKMNPLKLIKIENQFSKCKEMFNNDDRMVEIDINELDIEVGDIIIKPEDLSILTDLIKENIGLLSFDEFEYLEKRGFGEKTILDWEILGLSNIKDKRHLEIIGATCHPVLKKILTDGIENGGIIIPLFDENDILVNCAIRKINSSKSLKYSLACPDIPVWGLDRFEKGKEIWIAEGIFDMMALFNLGKKAVSCSSGMWTGLQLYQVLEKEPSSIVIFADNDSVGLRTSAILKEFFTINHIATKIVVSRIAKDPAEHYFQKNQNLDNLIEIDVTLDMIKEHKDDVFNFLRHMKNRKY